MWGGRIGIGAVDDSCGERKKVGVAFFVSLIFFYYFVDTLARYR